MSLLSLSQIKKTIMEIGNTVYLKVTEEVWNRPYVKKRHHSYDTRSVILQGRIIDVKLPEYKVQLYGNNGFEKDGGMFVFHKNDFIFNQNYKDMESLGKWEYSVNA
jgi:hypothetical protein